MAPASVTCTAFSSAESICPSESVWEPTHSPPHPKASIPGTKTWDFRCLLPFLWETELLLPPYPVPPEGKTTRCA